MTSPRPALFRRLFRASSDPADAVRPLWHRVVEVARRPDWYARHGVADTVPGRFDMMTTILTLAVLRMENEPGLQEASAHLIELFVTDMDGQLREFGINDVVVGKHMGRLMSTLGGRMGAYRDALRADDLEELAEAIRRNVTLADEDGATGLAADLKQLADVLARTPGDKLLAGTWG